MEQTLPRNLRIVLKHDKNEHVLEDPLPEEPADNTTTKNAYQKLVDEINGDQLSDAGLYGARFAIAFRKC